MAIHFFHQLFLHFCLDWLADLTQIGRRTKSKMFLNIKYTFWDAFLHCIKHITTNVLTGLFFSPTELRKGGSELDNLREVYTFSGHSAVWTKGVSLRCEKELLAWLQGARPGGEGPAVRRLVPFTLALISKPPFTASSALIHKSQGFTAARLINTGLQWFWTLPLLQDHLFIWK